MKIEFNNYVQGEMYERYLNETPMISWPNDTIEKKYYHDIDGLTERLVSDLTDEMEKNKMNPMKISRKGIWVENQRCYLEMQVQDDHNPRDRIYKGTTSGGLLKKKRHYDVFPETVASGTVTFERPYGIDTSPMLDILNTLGYETREVPLPDNLKKLASILEGDIQGITLNIQTEESE